MDKATAELERQAYDKGFEDGFAAGRTDAEEDIELLLDEIESELDDFSFEYTNKYTGSAVDCVEMKNVSKIIEHIKGRRKHEA